MTEGGGGGTRPGALVLAGYGINCDYETADACARAGFYPRRAHLNDVIAEGRALFRHKLVVFPGGFSFGDDLGSGVAFAAKVRYAAAGAGGRLIDLFGEYVAKGGLVLGICNGFQILARMGLVPDLDGGGGVQQVTLAPNREGYFIDRWVRLAVEGGSPNVFTRGLRTLSLPVRHGEGRFIPSGDALMARVEERKLVALRYCDERGLPTMEFPQNPNGSASAVAGICDPTGRVFGLMPHPEAAVSIYQYPDWTRRREEAGRRGVPLDEAGEGLRIFENARAYVG